MKVLYGVCGEGMGHAIRSAVVGEHLRAQGHVVTFGCAPGKAASYLSRKFPLSVVPVPGLGSSMLGNEIRPFATLAANLAQQAWSFPFGHMMSAGRVLLAGGKPDVVISDFDWWTARFAHFAGIPLVAVDNIHFMNRFDHPGIVVNGDRASAALMHPVVSNMVPSARRYLVTTFASATPRKPDTSEHLPILRPATFQAPTRIGPHVVAYFNDKSDISGIVKELGKIPHQSFRLYGTGVAQDTPGLGAPNVTLCPAGDRLLEDLASSKAAMGGAGFTFMTESIYLGKPFLAVPFKAQFEQILNANYLRLMGFGERTDRITAEGVRGFLSRLDGYRQNLGALKHDRNAELLASVERAIA